MIGVDQYTFSTVSFAIFFSECMLVDHGEKFVAKTIQITLSTQVITDQKIVEPEVT